ncbi:hypothetical protein ACOMHN_022344 [Nucella lapillus]
MADASASLPSVHPKSVASESKTVEETSMRASSSGHSSSASSEEQTKEINMSSKCPSDYKKTLGSEETAYVLLPFSAQLRHIDVESVDTPSSDDDEDRTSISDSVSCSHISAPAQDVDGWKDHPSTPRVPWRKGGIWHLRSGIHQREVTDGHDRDDRPQRPLDIRRTSPVGSGRKSQTFSAQSDSDSDSSVSVRDYPHLYGEEFDDTESESEMRAWREFLRVEPHMMDNDLDQDPLGPPEEPLYPQGSLDETECYVCFEESELRRRLCCDFPVCDRCLESYLMVQVLQANVNIECLNISCNSYIHRNEISARLPPKFKIKFYKFLIDANIDPSVKTCPQCSHGLQVDKTTLKKRKVIKHGLHVTCKRCSLEWCFTCHAPLHKGLTCKRFRKGDILLKEWAKEFHYGQLNAQQCPKCKIFIQRSLGCDHMMCTRCRTNFCYRCGESYRGIKLLGNHFSRYSPFGCRYNFMPDAPHMRRLIRGAVLGGKLLGGLVLSGFVVAAGACLLGVSVIALPAWGGYKLHKRRRFRQHLRANQKYAKQNLALRNLQAKKAADIFVPSFPIPALDSSDSMADDSSDEMRDRVVVGLELPDAQRVEVLVHQTISSSSDQEEGGGGASADTREMVTESAVIITDVQEVMNEDGYTTVITNVYAKPRNPTTHTSPATSSEDSDEERPSPDERGSSSGSQKDERGSSVLKRSSTSKKEGRKPGVMNEKKLEEEGDGCSVDRDRVSMSGVKMNECNNEDQQNLPPKHHKTRDKETGPTQEKKPEEANVAKEKKEKSGENTEKKQTECESSAEKKDKEKASDSWERKGEKDPCPCKLPTDQKDIDELSKESTNGCFGNIFSKKISVIQIGNKRNAETPPDTQKPTNASYKSSTWEKSQEKPSHHKHKTSMDIQDLSCFKEKLSLEASDIYAKPPVYNKGVLLQDFVVLSPPGDFRSSEGVRGESDSLSLASASSVEDAGSGKEGGEKGGEGSSCCCLSASDSFRGSNLSCDIVTYL